MEITTVLFDLDGTLLPMDQDEFTKVYFGLLAKKLAPYGYAPKQLVDAIWAGTAAMVGNDGKRRNEAVFWDCFQERFGPKVYEDLPVFEDFYTNEFAGAKAACGFNPEAARSVRAIRHSGCRVVLATNPLFPSVATQARIRWAGLEPEDFEFYTTYENSSFCKPNLEYYREILARLNVGPAECLMVGNDVAEDMVARKLGMRVFLLTDCLLNKEGQDITRFPRGSFPELMEYIKKEQQSTMYTK